MRKAVFGAAAVLLLAIGVAIGWLVGARGHDPARPVAGEPGEARPENAVPLPAAPGTRYRVGDPRLLEPPPSWEEWKYPGSRVHRAKNAGPSFIGKIKSGAVDWVALVSGDEFDKVWGFYRDKVEQKVLADGRTPTAVSGHEWEGDKWVPTVVIYDRHYACANEPPESDLLQAKGFWVQTLRYKLAGFVSRAKGSDSTDVLLFYRTDNEFIGLLREELNRE